MPKREIRFSIHDGCGKRAGTWKCWSPSNSSKHDIYVSNRELGGAIKTSFHQSGQCHMAYFPNYWEENVPDDKKSRSGRFIHKWTVPDPNEAGCILLLRVVTPYTSTTVPFESSDYKKMYWVENCPPGMATEVYLILALPGAVSNGWPGKNGMGSKLIGSYELANRATVWLVYRPIALPNLTGINGRFNFFKGKRKRDLFDEGTKKAIVMGSEPDGSQTLYDCAVEIGKNFPPYASYIRYLNRLEKDGSKNTLPRGKFFDKFR